MKDAKADELRITLQFRSGRAMVYELRHNTSRLTLKVFERQSAAEPGAFRVEATPGNGPDALTATGWGETRADALKEAGRSWSEASGNSALPAFDWEAVASALRSVRAL